MTRDINKNLIELTKIEFQPYYGSELSDIDACEIINNFSGYMKLLIKLDKRRNEVKKEEKNARKPKNNV